jgi:hypothetical protein
MLIWNCDKYVHMEWNVSNTKGLLINNKISKTYECASSMKELKIDFYNILKKSLKKTSSMSDLKVKEISWWSKNNHKLNGINIEFKICLLGLYLEESEFKFIRNYLDKLNRSEQYLFFSGITHIYNNIISLNGCIDYKTKISFINLIEFLCEKLGIAYRYNIELDCLSFE